VDLGAAAFPVDEMLRRGMDVPPDVEDFLAVELKAREALDVAFRVVRCPGWGELPVEEITRDFDGLVALEVRLVVYGEIFLGDVDGRLMCSRLAQVVFCRASARSRSV
jgi:hypothetical protein